MFENITQNDVYIVVDEHDNTWPCATAIDAQAKLEELRQAGIKATAIMVLGHNN